MDEAFTESEKLRELSLLLCYYDQAIHKQKTLINQIESGELRFAQVSDKVLYALARGDLKLLKRRKIDTQAVYDKTFREQETDLAETIEIEENRPTSSNSEGEQLLIED